MIGQHSPVLITRIRKLLSIFALALLSACGGGGDSPTAPAPKGNGGNNGGTNSTPVRMDLSTAAITFGSLGATERVTATVRDGSGAAIANAALSWSSSNITVVDVSGNGSSATVTARAPGNAIITAQSGSLVQSISVSVLEIRSLSLSPSSLSIRAGEQSVLRPSFDADPGSSTSIVWSSEDATVATVSSNGTVTGVSIGSTVVRARSQGDTRIESFAAVTVTAARAIVITGAPTALRVGDSASLGVDFPAGTPNSPAVLWSSSNSAVASVSSDGVVSALAPGSTVLRVVLAADPQLSDSISLQIHSARSVVVSPASASLGTGETRQFSANVQVDPGMSSAISWRSSDAAVAIVNASGLVTAVGQGKATITAVSIADPAREGSAEVSVVPVVRDIEITPAVLSMYTSTTRQLTVNLSADEGVSRTLIWQSSNPSVVSAGPNGLLTALSAGTAVITAVVQADTSKRATALVTVRTAPLITLSPVNISLGTGKTATLVATVSGTNGSNTLVFSSSNPAIASVNSSGVITGVGVGSAIITAALESDPSVRATAQVTVVSGSLPQLISQWTSTSINGPLNEDVISLHVVNANEIFAVNLRGNIYRYLNGNWTVSATGEDFNTRFIALSGIGSDRIIAVGTNGTIVRFNGSSWSSMNSGTAATLYGVHLESRTNGFAVGENGTALRYDGSTWTSTVTGTSEALSGVWTFAGQAMAVGTGGTILRFNGSRWASLVSGTTETLYSVTGTSIVDLVAVGAFGTILRFNGANWTRIPAGAIVSDFYGVTSGRYSDGVMYIASDDGILALDGNTLSQVSTPYAPRFYSVATSSTGSLFTGGQRGLVLRKSGSWETLNAAPDLIDVWTASGSDTWAVGEFGFIYHWDGSEWSRQLTPTTSTLNTVWASGPGVAFAGGDYGTMLRWDGGAWTAMAFPSSGTVYGLWGSSASDVHAITASGEILHYDGSVWKIVETTSAALWAVYGSSPTDVYVAGANGTVLHFDGHSWSAIKVSTSNILTGIYAAIPGQALAVGTNPTGGGGASYQWASGHWGALSVGSGKALTSIWGPGSNDVYVSGDAGTMLHFNGSTWNSMNTGSTELLWAVSGAPGASVNGFAVGYNGTIVLGSAGGTGARVAAAAKATTAFRASARSAGAGLNPAPGAHTARGALPFGQARQNRKSR